MCILTILTTAAAFLCSTLAPAQGAGAITNVPNTCATYSHGCTGTPVIGGSLTWATGASLSLGGAYLAVDFGGPAWNGAAVPQPLGPFSASLAGCMQLAAADLLIPMQLGWSTVAIVIGGNLSFTTAPYFWWDQSIPMNQALIGLSFRTQMLLWEAQGLAASDGCIVTIG